MKCNYQFILLFIVMSIPNSGLGQEYFWSNGQKNYLEVDSSVFTLQSTSINSSFTNSKLIKSLTLSKTGVLKGEVNSGQKGAALEFLKNQPEVTFDICKNKHGNRMRSTGVIVMKPKKGVDMKILLKKYRFIIKKHWMSERGLHYVIPKKKADIFFLANTIYETNQVKFSHPDFIVGFSNFNNDPYYPQQYYLDNTGQFGWTSGVDINAPEAWDISTGMYDVKVAVIDDGVEIHDELTGRLLPGYNPPQHPQVSGAQASTAHGHGQSVAGIIAAESNNGDGISGISPFAQVIPVNITGYQGLSESQKADGIHWAWSTAGADVLNNSWGNPDDTPFDVVIDEITDARTLGRNGKGTVVVVATGNSNANTSGFIGMHFPSTAPGVISIGALDGNDVIWNFSDRGTGMNLVAPTGNKGGLGDQVTIDREGPAGYRTNDIMANFGATSGAAPQVSAVAALMISVNPTLTELEIKDMLHSTARDLGTIGYDTIYGYGALDAEAALSLAIPEISGPDEACWRGGSTFSIDIPAGSTATWTVSSNKLTILSGQGTGTVNIGTSNPFHKSSEWISVSVNNNGAITNFPQKTVWTGTPFGMGNLFGPTSVNQFQTVTYWITNPSGEGTIKWKMPNAGCDPNLGECWLVSGGGDGYDYLVAIIGKNSGYLEAYRENSCGQGAYSRLYVNVTPTGGCPICPITVLASNPAKDNLKIIFKSKKNKIKLSEGLFEEERHYVIHDHQGNQIMSFKSFSKNPNLNLRKLMKGNYILTIVHGRLGIDKHHLVIN